MHHTFPAIVRILALVALIPASVLRVAAQADPKETWTQHCMRCHGADGTANTKMGRKLSIKDLTQQRVQMRLTDNRIEEAIAEGLRDDEGKEEMPAFREKLSEPERRALIAFVRSLKK